MMSRIVFRRLGLGCCLGLVTVIGFVGCSDSTEAPESVTEAIENGETKLPSGEELEKVAGEAVDAVSDGVSVAWDKASSAMKDFEGGREMMGSMQEMYASAKTSLSDVTSEESALKAKSELDNLSAKIEDWKPQLSEMSTEAKVGAKRFFDHVAEQLSSFAEQLKENQWVNEILKPKLQEVIDQLKSLV
ncbi:hypothetical protein N9Z67_00200 [Rhodopirellula sp.]|nr:hypothetical protein [bacterium]MDB4393748.1 hypothetical protein [Rhodopirellula sp.]